jgi:hypothetical protein
MNFGWWAGGSVRWEGEREKTTHMNAHAQARARAHTHTYTHTHTHTHARTLAHGLNRIASIQIYTFAGWASIRTRCVNA